MRACVRVCCCSAKTDHERLDALVETCRRFPGMCTRGVALVTGASEARARQVGHGVLSETETGELYEEVHGLVDYLPLNRLPDWAIDDIEELLNTYSWHDPTARTENGLGIRRPTSADAEGFDNLWGFVLDPEMTRWNKLRDATSRSTFENYVRKLLAFENCKLLGCTWCVRAHARAHCIGAVYMCKRGGRI